MLIVSQGKDSIVNTKQTEIIEISDDSSIVVNGFTEIAKYESLSKAKAELQNLWSAYANDQKVYFMN